MKSNQNAFLSVNVTADERLGPRYRLQLFLVRIEAGSEPLEVLELSCSGLLAERRPSLKPGSRLHLQLNPIGPIWAEIVRVASSGHLAAKFERPLTQAELQAVLGSAGIDDPSVKHSSPADRGLRQYAPAAPSLQSRFLLMLVLGAGAWLLLFLLYGLGSSLLN